jgi:hypothetical protein
MGTVATGPVVGQRCRYLIGHLNKHQPNTNPAECRRRYGFAMHHVIYKKPIVIRVIILMEWSRNGRTRILEVEMKVQVTGRQRKKKKDKRDDSVRSWSLFLVCFSSFCVPICRFSQVVYRCTESNLTSPFHVQSYISFDTIVIPIIKTPHLHLFHSTQCFPF